MVVGAVGFGFLAGGIQRGGLTGMAGAALGGFLIARAVTTTHADLVPEAEPTSSVTVERTLDLAAPVREVFRFWSDLQNLPRFMRHLREVRENESGTSHWVADAPRGAAVSWDAEIVALKPHRRIAWKSLPGAPVISAGDVEFDELDNGTTRLHVRLTYPRGGERPTLFGLDPHRQVEEDLARLRQLLERTADLQPDTVSAPDGAQLVH
jgi:uncharacterized membrane protein